MIFIVDLFLCVRRVSFPVSAEEAVALGGGGGEARGRGQICGTGVFDAQSDAKQFF